jgi:hypothetical protein
MVAELDATCERAAFRTEELMPGLQEHAAVPVTSARMRPVLRRVPVDAATTTGSSQNFASWHPAS